MWAKDYTTIVRVNCTQSLLNKCIGPLVSNSQTPHQVQLPQQHPSDPCSRRPDQLFFCCCEPYCKSLGQHCDRIPEKLEIAVCQIVSMPSKTPVENIAKFPQLNAEIMTQLSYLPLKIVLPQARASPPLPCTPINLLVPNRLVPNPSQAIHKFDKTHRNDEHPRQVVTTTI